jgi:integrase
MQLREYPERDGHRIWLSREEQTRLVDQPGDDYPRRRIAYEMGLHGLRSDEIAKVEFRHFKTIDSDHDQHAMVVPDGKTGRRRTPVNEELNQLVTLMKSARRANKDDKVVGVATRTMRSWMKQTREELAEETGDERWNSVTFHDTRRTYATDAFYSLAYQGVPIAEELVMAFGGWSMTATGRETFRNHYLGPVPDHIVRKAAEKMHFG